MLDKKDAQWWVLEVEKRPQAAPDLVRMLADRLAFLDKQNEELRGEMIALRRQIRGSTTTVETAALQRRIQELEGLLRQGISGRRVVVYGPDRIEINQPLDAEFVLNRELLGDPRVDQRLGLLVCLPGANLLILTGDSRAFFVAQAELPEPESGGDAIPLGNPRDVTVIIDRAQFERNRFLLLVSKKGYAYSLLAGTINAVAGRQEKLIRNLIPGDPIISAIPSQNGDLFAISQRGRWTRFSERTLAGSGSLIMDLPKGDALAGVASLTGEANLLFLSTEGRLYARRSEDLPARKVTGGSAGQLFKTQTIVSLAVSSTQDEFVIATKRGRILHVPIKPLLEAASSEMGVRVPGFEVGDMPLLMAGL